MINSENIIKNDPEYLVRPELNKKIEFLTDELNFVDELGNSIDVLDYERPEQVLNVKFIPSEAKVLEIGGRYGVASCFINKCLNEDNKKNHVVVEPDTTVLNALKRNRKTNGCEFEIFNGTVSEEALSLIPCGSATRSQPDNSSLIEYMTYQEIQKEYKIEFDTLVVDCEGFFETFLDAFHVDMNSIKYIFLEYDFPNLSNYDRVENILTDLGFRIEYQQFSHWHGLSCWHKIWVR